MADGLEPAERAGIVELMTVFELGTTAVIDHPCFAYPLATPYDCVVDTTQDGQLWYVMPPCESGLDLHLCWRVVTDAKACASEQHSRLLVEDHGFTKGRYVLRAQCTERY